MIQVDYERLVEDYAPAMYRLAYNYGLNRADAEDAVQQVFLKYLERPPDCAGPGQLRAWLMTATANKCKNLLSSGWRRKTLSLEDVYASPDHFDEILEVRAALAKLPPHLRGVVNLFYFEQMPVKQIAETLHLTETAVHSRLHKTVPLYSQRTCLRRPLGP